MKTQTDVVHTDYLYPNGRVELPIVPQSSNDPLAEYALQMLSWYATSSPIDDVLHEMEELAESDNIPIIGPLEGAILQVCLQMRQPPPKRILDIGTAIGYSALWMARGLPTDCKIISIEIDPQRAQRAREFVAKAGCQSQIEILVGDVFDLLPDLGEFDVIFQDVIKHKYFGSDSELSLKLLDCCLEHLCAQGVLFGDNAFCMGEVLHNPTDELPTQVVGIQAYNTTIAAHPQLSSVIIPVRDGLWVSNKLA